MNKMIKKNREDRKKKKRSRKEERETKGRKGGERSVGIEKVDFLRCLRVTLNITIRSVGTYNICEPNNWREKMRAREKIS